MDSLVKTVWLSKRLGLSVRTIERMRSSRPTEIPPHIVIGGCIRYDVKQVEKWLASRLVYQCEKGDGNG